MKVVLSILLSLSLRVSARVGETIEQVAKRLGGPPPAVIEEDKGYKLVKYNSGEMTVYVTFIDGTSSAESYAPLAPDGIKEILQQHFAGEWEGFTPDGWSNHFYRGPRGLFAHYIERSGSLSVSDGRRERYLEGKKKTK